MHVQGRIGGSREPAMVIAFLENRLDRQGLVESSLDWSGPACRAGNGHSVSCNSSFHCSPAKFLKGKGYQIVLLSMLA